MYSEEPDNKIAEQNEEELAVVFVQCFEVSSTSKSVFGSLENLSFSRIQFLVWPIATEIAL